MLNYALLYNLFFIDAKPFWSLYDMYVLFQLTDIMILQVWNNVHHGQRPHWLKNIVNIMVQLQSSDIIMCFNPCRPKSVEVICGYFFHSFEAGIADAISSLKWMSLISKFELFD